MLKIQILVDNPKSWIVPYAKSLVDQLYNLGHNTILIHDYKQVVEGDILCLLACERIFKGLHLNKHNLVVHESDLPSGKGWSPVSWQVLEGKKRIPVTLIEAHERVDSGDIYSQREILLKGDELWPEIKHQQGEQTIALIVDFVNKYPEVEGKPQLGEESFYPKRTAESSELDVSNSIENQFNLLRICDNDRFPAFFMKDGIKYILKIHKDE